jgi:hypothetical protein
MNGTRDHHVKQSKPDSESQTSWFLSYAEYRLRKKHLKIKKGLFGKRKGTVGRGQEKVLRVNIIKGYYLHV